MKTINEFITELKENNFSVYTSDNKENITYFYFVKNNKIGYCQYEYGFSFSTVHKPCKEAGTGFRVYSEITEPTIKHAEDCFIKRPLWNTFNNTCKCCGSYLYKTDPVIKFNSWKEYINSPLGSILKYRQL